MKIYRIAQLCVAIAHGISAVLFLAFGLLFVAIGLRLGFVFSSSWIAIGIGAFLGLNGVALCVKGCELFVSTRPAERPDEWQHYLRSRSLYVPEDNTASSRRERGV